MLLENLKIFCERSDKYKQEFARYLNLQDLSRSERNDVLESLCHCLMEPACTKDVARCFAQFLPLLLARALRMDISECRGDLDAERSHRLNCVVLGTLIETHPDVLGYALRYFEHNPAPFATSFENLAVTAKRRKGNTPPFVAREVSNLEIVTASYNILEAASEHFEHRWNWSEFYHFLTDEDDTVKWIALKCVGIVLRMSESRRLACARILIKDPDRYSLERSDGIIGVMSTFESECIEEINDASRENDGLVSIAGVLLPVFDTNRRPPRTNLIPVPSMESNLRSLALAVASRRCVCLQGSVGCGKTALVEYLADITGHADKNLVKVQLGDQTDSKMLLGTYRCTDVPGEFVWQPGVLTQAVMNGKWLLLEDIDSAALDVASCLSNLIETGTLSVPGYRDTIHAKCGFQLFLTQRLIKTASGLHRQVSGVGATNLLEKHWFCVHVESLNREELVTVVRSLFPQLTTVATRMIDVFLLFSVGDHESENTESKNSLPRTGRSISTRDLIKWCTRAVVDYEVSSPDSALKIFQDAIDIFCCSVADQSSRLELATAIGHTLGIVRTKAEYFCNAHKPTIKLLSDTFQAGRAKLRRKMSDYARVERARMKFSYTRPSATLLERVTCCVAQREPVLLVGETGTGKTSSIQYLAECTGHKLIVINMNQQSESADLLGGYKPVDFKYLVTPIREEFEMLFRSYFAIEPNRKFLEHVAACHKQHKWRTLVGLMCHSAGAAVKRLRAKLDDIKNSKEDDREKSGKTEMLSRWERLTIKLEKLRTRVKTNYSLAFAFLEGSLIKALQEGHWVLLDEINLASSETLECLSGLLEGATGSLSLLERGDSETVQRHPDFTIFACMNPATDVGKKELPIGLRNRFTEFYVDELTERTDLQLLVDSYLRDANLCTERQEAIVKFYLNVRREALQTLNDGTGHKPHYSLRTLCRALSVASTNPCGSVQRSLYEAFSLSFLTQLDHSSYPRVVKLIARAILDPKTAKGVLASPIPKPVCRQETEDYVNFEGYWIVRGTQELKVSDNYVLTCSVRRNLRDLVRVVSIGKMPILLQGDTSVGKTSLIAYLARASGHTCLRINNHEHTDLQEYVGCYVADETGKLVFKEGILVEAMRKGQWIILDELNLAPSDVLEALNRVLDDNRELFIPETQRVVKAHPNFMLFATQNPPGLYGGRKVLSRAFRNRFVELHFDEIPPDELSIILHERCRMPQSYCKQIIGVMSELQTRRKSTSTFQGKHGFVTLRDLFRWGERYRLASHVPTGLYDWSQHLADEGYLVLAAKVRRNEEAREIAQVIEKYLKRRVDPANLFDLHEKTSSVTRTILEEILRRDANSSDFDHIVWTRHMRRMAVLVRKSCQFKEPVLLVGETGGGKTTVCQLIAAMGKQRLYSVNCHMHSESSDFLGNLRPVREHANTESQKLFEWVDGPLINAMRNGDLFLADEISLADDSVLERLNSLLEPERSLLLAEKGVDSADSGESECIITANEMFQFIGTMNPGGDYGKKELSPALRNRFTEIWCEGCVDECDLRAIIEHNLNSGIREKRETVARSMLTFVEWLKGSEVGKRFTVSIRDVLTWVNFINACTGENEVSRLSLSEAYLHGACLTYIDSLGSGLTGMESAEKLEAFRNSALNLLKAQMIDATPETIGEETFAGVDETMDQTSRNVFGIAPFYIHKGPHGRDSDDQHFTFAAPTTRSNTLKLLRALQLKKPLLLEGSPGVGKTSLVAALARASGHNVLRINLSDQTDVSDLFGADLPLEGGKGGQFAWKDGPFLRALRAGDWILLDELNLASQSVLEGLNACLDHRGEIYVPELGRTFTVMPATKLFACQNPLRQGGARRGLPKSFLNRFTQVYVDALNDHDLKLIARSQFADIPCDILEKVVDFNSKLAREAGTSWGRSGSPWEMNLRDITRWCESIVASSQKSSPDRDSPCYNPGDGVDLVYVDRMRTEVDRRKVYEIYEETFPIEKYPVKARQPIAHVNDESIHLGDVTLTREERYIGNEQDLLLLRDQLAVLRSLAQCVEMNWMPILVGGPGCGKSSVVRVLAQLTGERLRSIVVNSAMDTTEILGGFEQTDYNRHLEQLLERVEGLLVEYLKLRLNEDDLKAVVEYHSWLERVQNLSHEENQKTTMAAETELFLRRTKELWKLVGAMKSLDNSPIIELQLIDEQLRKLAVNVKEDKCLNAGGKFEWVDSVLVKCLQDGSWLVLDQVNLCSPAVLDRLNGLLEPGGVLTIGERGVANDGDILTIKPHKNFRLFLTMDPRYGEISRAMRNRGVEIFMLGHKENKTNDVLDLRSMLHNIGLKASNHQEAMLEIHEKMYEDDSMSERPSPVDLLRSAFLINQQTSRGFCPIEAFRTACHNVYVKSRCVQRSLAKERLNGIIEESIARHEVKRRVENLFDLGSVTPRLRDLRNNSRLSIVAQQGFALKAALRCHAREKDATMSRINVYLSMTRSPGDNDFEMVTILPYLLLNFYENSSIDDVQLRKRWLAQVLSDNGCIDSTRILEERSEQLACEIETSRHEFEVKKLPWDSANTPNYANSDNNRGRANRLALILYSIAMGVQFPRILEDIPLDKSKKIISVSEYSSSVYHGKLTSHLKNQPLITNFVMFVSQLSTCLNLIFRDGATLVNSQEYVKLRQNFVWLERFHSLGKLPLIDRTEKTSKLYGNLDETLLTLRVHYKWLVKFVKSLFDFVDKFASSDECRKEIERMYVMIRDIDESCKSVDDPFRKIAKRVKKYLIAPPPFSSCATVEVYARAKKFTELLAPCAIERGDSALKGELKIILLRSDVSARIRAELINIWKRFYNAQDFDEAIMQAFQNMEESCDRENLGLRTPTEVSQALARVRAHRERDAVDIAASVQLWPIYEYVFFVLANNMHRKITQDMSAATGYAALIKLSQIPSIPINLVSLLAAIVGCDKEASSDRARHEIFIRLERFVRDSCAFADSKSFLHWSGISETDVEKSLIDLENRVRTVDPVGSPVLVNLVSELIINDSPTVHEKSILATARLGTYRSRMSQLKTLNGLLWRNSVALNSTEYDVARNDRLALLSYLGVFLKAEEKMAGEREPRDILESEIAKLKDSLRIELEEKFQRDYIEPLKELRRKTRSISDSVESRDNELSQRYEAWILLGYIQVFLFGNLGYIDPVHKVSLKLRYVEDDIENCRRTLYVASLNSRILGDVFPSANTSRRMLETRDVLVVLDDERNELKTCSAVRPSNMEFLSLAKESHNFRNSLASWPIIGKMMKKLSGVIQELNSWSDPSSDVLSRANDATQEAEIWLESLQRFSEQLDKKFSSGYPDLVIPLLTAVAQLRHGMRGLSDEARRLANLRVSSERTNSAESLMLNLLRFPTIGKDQSDLIDLVQICTSSSTREVINKSTRKALDDAYVALAEQFRMVKVGLFEIHNRISLEGKLDTNLWRELNLLLQQIVLIWQKQRDENVKRSAEKDSLYVNKAKVYGDRTNAEEEEIARELRALFPTTRDEDFEDIDTTDAPTLERVVSRDDGDTETADRRYSGLITDHDIHEVHIVHSRIVNCFAKATWLKKSLEINERNYIEPLIQRYHTFSLMLENLLPALDYRLSSRLYASLNLLTAVTVCTSEASLETRDPLTEKGSILERKIYDYYRSGNAEEAKQCLPILEAIIDRVEGFLKEWPDHPTLRSIRSIVRRIYGFSITSPISRFLTGLELLLVKMKEWEENAHSGVSLSELSLSLTQQIISWRRLELACWKNCLNAAHERVASKASKWWFFLYALIESYTTNTSLRVDAPTVSSETDAPITRSEEPISDAKLIELLEAFISGSSIVEFQPRLDLLLTFHCHAYHLPQTHERDRLLAILWNVYNYYGQFVGDVEKKIKSVRSPIEKKLRDFVKIARWNDINYWSVKETVDKTHRTLHKFVREYETGIGISVATCLLIKSSSYSSEAVKGEWDRSRERDYAIDPRDFVHPGKINVGTFADGVGTRDYPDHGELVSRMDTLLSKAKRLGRECILMSSYPILRVSLEEFMENMISHATHLKSMDIDRTLPKPKQKAYAKSILQQKRMALADYFKTLTRIGVSYRSGTLAWKNRRSEVIDLKVPPIDIHACLESLDHGKADKQLLAQWDGCESYYYKSMIQLNALNAALAKNQTDLGMPNVVRCSGYSCQMMLMAHRQKRLIADSFGSYLYLRTRVASLPELLDLPSSTSGDREWRECAKGLKTLIVSLRIVFEQMKLYLLACPAEPDLDASTEILTLETSTLDIVNATRNDPAWQATNSLLLNCLASLNSIAESYEKAFHWEIPFVTPVHYRFLNKSNHILLNVKRHIGELARVFSNGTETSHPILESVQFLESRVDEWMEKFLLIDATEISTGETATRDEFAMSEYVSRVELLVKTILLAIQQKYKDTIFTNESVDVRGDEEEDDNADEEGKEIEEESEQMEENSFREKLIASLEKDVKNLRLDEVQRCFANLLETITVEDPSLTSQRRSLLSRCLPLLKQYLLFSQFYLNEQVGAFRTTCKFLHLQLGVFLDLAANGFCVPKDLDLEEGEGEETKEGKTQNGMGLGDGEGEKDVSDRIETEDQLDEARPADQEKEKKEDKDCKEEENGIDMSEDFEGKMQDVEKNPDDENDSGDDEDDEDLDKQMGDTEQGADALDEEVWGDDRDESPSDNEEEREEENKGKGEAVGEKEMTAKDDAKNKKDEDETNEDGDRREEEKPEINEMNEPELNDDQIDPYHGKQAPPPEPEPMDLPDDMNLDGEEADDKEAQGDEENPFDIDEMKDCMPPAEKDETADAQDEKDHTEEKDPIEDSSDDEADDPANTGDVQPADDDVPENEPTEVESEAKTQAPEKNVDGEKDESKDEEIGDEERASASAEDPSKEMDATDQTDIGKDGTRDKMADQPNVDEEQEATAENAEEDVNNRGTGSAQSEQQETGHSGSSAERTAPVQHREKEATQRNEKRKNPGESDENRSLVEKLQSDWKKMKMIHSRDETKQDGKEEGAEDTSEEKNEIDMCEHVKNSEKYDDQATDAATRDQVKKQAANVEDEEEKKEEETMEVDMNVDQEDTSKEEDNATPEQSSESVQGKDKERRDKSESKGNNPEDPRMDSAVEVEGDTVMTMRVERGAESAFFTNIPESNVPLSSVQLADKRMEVESMLGRWTYAPSTDEALAAWNCLSSVVEAPARDLAEKLRLVLEPTQATRLKGDYRTGRRINMRKIIPYIASQFRKDKIWLRRTKPSKRDYQIVLALDDSSSMADNHSKELAFESMSLISKAMGYLEVGELSVLSFGEAINVLHPLGQPFTENSGSRLIQEIRFDQKKTKVGHLVDFTVDMFENQKSSTDSAKLLVVLSDGRGVFSEGLDQVNSAVRRARLADIFLVFIIVDNPLNKDSILDIRMPVFEAGKLLGIKSYMDSFPFPFYMILRDINALPGVLSDALRQWFEVVGKIDT